MADYFTNAELEAEVADSDLWLRLFDRDGDGVADSAVITRCRTRAQNLLDAELAHSHGTPWTTTGNVPALAKDIAMDLALCFAAGRTSDMSDAERGPFGARWKQARTALDALKKDRGQRFPETGAPVPVSTAEAAITVPTSSTVWQDAFNPDNGGCGF
jgi:hypothetical protein